MNFSICIADYVLEISVLHYYAGCEARTYGPPENCYKAEYPYIEWEIDSAVYEGEEGTFSCSTEELDFIKNEFSVEIEEKLYEEIREMNDALNDAYEGQRESDWEY